MNNKFTMEIKQKLMEIIHDMKLQIENFVKNPNTDFTRKRKLDFETLMKFTLSMEGNSIKKEMLGYFGFAGDSVTASAYNQQRSKILPEAFDFLFHKFTSTIEKVSLYDGYRLIACDGSNINIAHNPKDIDTYFKSKPSEKGFNILHLNAFYDLLNRIYLDAIIQPGRKANEFMACTQMIDRYECTEKVILIADRGYENYNIFAHSENKGWNYIVRVKDKDSSRIVSGLNISEEGDFDKTFSFLLTRRQTNEVKSHPDTYKFLHQNSNFDYLPVGDKGTYPISFRVVRFPISDQTYETIITNLDANEFPAYRIKELYNMRWGVETSFRELKYSIGLANLHAKKVDYINQEIFARLTVYNFCESITSQVILRQQKHTKHSYHVNFTMAVYICKYFLRNKNDTNPPDVEMLIRKYILSTQKSPTKDICKLFVQGSITIYL